LAGRPGRRNRRPPSRLLRQLGIGIPAFQIAGGLLLFGVSNRMIFGGRPHREAREADKATSEHASDVAVFALAIPMMAGPGAIATTPLLTGDAGYGARLAIIISVVVFVCLLCVLCFLSAGLIAHARAHRQCGGVARARNAACRLFGAVRDQRNCYCPGKPLIGLRQSVNLSILRYIS